MRSQKSNIRNDLIILLIGIIILNVGFTFILSELVVESDIEKLDKHLAQVQSGKIPVTKERYIKTIEGLKKYSIATDKSLDVFQKSIGLLALANIFIVAIMVTLLIRKDKKRNE